MGFGGADVKPKAKWFALIGTFVIAIAPSVGIGQGIWDSPGGIPFSSTQPTVSVGYLSPNRPTTFHLGNTASDKFNISSLQQTLNVQGVWTEFTIPVKGSGPLGLILDFGYLFPVNSQSEETYNLYSGPAGRTWNTSSQLWNLQIAATYSVSPVLSTVLGFRYESFMTNFRDYEKPGAPGNLEFNEDAVGGTDFTFSGYIPFLGAVVESSPVSAARFKAGVIGFPALPGAFVYREVVNSDTSGSIYPKGNGLLTSNEFDSGYFLEAFGQASIPIAWWARVGAFVKYSGVYGKKNRGDVNTTVAEFATDGLIRPKSYHSDADASFERSSWIFGGTISAGF